MNTRGRYHPLGALLLTLLPAVAAAQETIGLDFFLGYQLDPTLAPAAGAPPEAGMDPFNRYSRSPYGLLYGVPRTPPPGRPLGESGWTMALVSEVGMLVDASNTAAATYREYGDLSGDGAFGRFSLALEQPKEALYLHLKAGAVGRDDVTVRARGGRYGRFRVAAYYDQIPHWFADDASVIWDGVGSSRLSLPTGLPPGASDLSAIRSAFDNTDLRDIALERTQFGVSARMMPNTRWTLFGEVKSEEREGTRPWGGAMSFPLFGQLMETLEPIDYRTTDLTGGVSYATARHQFNISWSSSFFRNDNTGLLWENAGLTVFGGDFVPERGQSALPPDNNYHHLRIDYARPLRLWQSRFSAALSYSLMEQDDRLLPPTVSTGVADGFALIDFDQWNSVQALSRQSADAELGQFTGFMRWVARPTRKLRLNARVRLMEQNNRTDYLAFNPVAGQYGYIALDGGIAGIPNRSGIFDPSQPGSRVPVATIPFEKDAFEAQAGADYRLGARTTLGLVYRRSETRHQIRERERVSDDQLRIQLQRRGNVSLRLSYEFTDRSGDEYDFSPYESFFSSSLPGFQPRFVEGNDPVGLSTLRVFDVASHEQHAVRFRSHMMLAENMDLSVTSAWEDRDYAARHGLRGARRFSGNLDWSYFPSLNTTLYAFMHYSDGDRGVRNINDTGGNSGSRSADPDPGGINYPLENEWAQSIDDRNTSAGLGFQKAVGKLEFELNYTYTTGSTRSVYEFASAAAAGASYTPGLDDTLPTISYRHQVLQSHVRWWLTDQLAVSLSYRFEQENLRDFHYQDWLDPVIERGSGGDVYLLALPRNYSANLALATVRWTF